MFHSFFFKIKNLVIAVTLLLSLVCLLESTLVLHNPITGKVDTLLQQHIKILQDLLKLENCPGLAMSENDMTVGDSFANDMKLSSHLNDLLIICRMAKQTSTTTSSTTEGRETSSSNTTPTQLIQTSEPIEVPTGRECLEARNLTEAWRLDYNPDNRNQEHSIDFADNCDPYTMVVEGRPWFRFSGAAGNRLLNDCPKRLFSCGGWIGLFSNDPMPSEKGVIKRIYAYTRDCDTTNRERPLSVIKCSERPNDFIYRHDGIFNCPYSYCGMKA